MKNSVLKIFVLFIINTNLTYSQDLLQKYPNVLSLKESIDKDTTLIEVTLANEEFLEHTDQGGELIGYYKDTILVKVKVIHYYTHGVENLSYYLQNKRYLPLSLMEETFDLYQYKEETNEFDFSKTERNFHGQYVFKDNKLIDQISTGHNRFEDETVDIQRTVNSELAIYKDLLAMKKH